ncbi:phosphonoacetate hydrolase [Snuella sedimenti]|uniref:Phosphonoacetate hydrolase n=1 Tax=Snuella sedimenti TaxID=2798802 RepID=A0A8J7IYH2_9FLAO|nr:phosphonoacetate hydrolase [Snuella sedimenti]MBJ6368930.1 phosphonoacetate hydrolase [Snuella sedimenti]
MKINNREYPKQKKTIIGICMDGTSYPYYEKAKDVMPNLQRFIKEGSMGLVKSVIPSFTNPNNMAITTGVPPKVNGICGNFYWDTELQEEVMMNDPKYLKVPTILSELSHNGRKVAVVTAKDKLRKMLAHNLDGICFSAEFADQATLEENGIENVESDLMGKERPGIYDPYISVYCIEAGAKLLQRDHYDVMYLTTTDFVQHKYAPGSEGANDFLAKIDHWLGELDKLGAIVGVTADHGMEAKTNADGSPKVQFIEKLLNEQGIKTRVILPITDPYVVHHGALGGYGTLYLDDKSQLEAAKTYLLSLDGIEKVLTNVEAVEAFELPSDRIGDLVVLSDAATTIGRTPEWHDLDKVKEGLRSHGSEHCQVVPMIFNKKLNDTYAEKLASGTCRNFDLFHFLSNGF